MLHQIEDRFLHLGEPPSHLLLHLLGNKLLQFCFCHARAPMGWRRDGPERRRRSSSSTRRCSLMLASATSLCSRKSFRLAKATGRLRISHVTSSPDQRSRPASRVCSSPPAASPPAGLPQALSPAAAVYHPSSAAPSSPPRSTAPASLSGPRSALAHPAAAD